MYIRRSYLVVSLDIFPYERCVENPFVECLDHHEFAPFWRAVPQTVMTLEQRNQTDDGSNRQL